VVVYIGPGLRTWWFPADKSGEWRKNIPCKIAILASSPPSLWVDGISLSLSGENMKMETETHAEKDAQKIDTKIGTHTRNLKRGLENKRHVEK
jgi:hypothetical protein